MRAPLGALAAVGFGAVIVAANYVTSHAGMVPVGFGLTATAGTYFAGLSFVLRDAVQDTLGRAAVLALIVAGAVTSAALSPSLALASGVAFLLSESADLAIYTPLRRRGYVRAALASNVAGALLDTFVFLALAGFPLTAWQGQMVGKLAMSAAVVALVVLVRARRAAVAA